MTNSDSEDDEKFDQVIHQYYQAVEAGEPVDPEAFIREHVEYERQLRSFFADLHVLENLPGLGEMAGTIDQSRTRNDTLIPSVASGDQVTYIGQYRLVEEIARGGMGVVFKATQENLSRIVALKMILSGPLASSAEVERFRREARAAARLKHPNIVPVHEIGQHDGHYFFTMDWVESESLADRLREGSLSAEESARLVEIIAHAMRYAHGEGVLHRDLKPANILIDKSGQPHITDFGLAKAQADADNETLREPTRTGQILGTPSYMSPEQASGKTDLVDVRSDVYSLGAILYACLVGRAPFVGESSVETLQKVIHEDPPSPRLLNSRVPKDLETICHKSLSKEPQHRYQTASQLAEDLNRYLNGHPVLARPVPAITRLHRWSRRHPAAAVLTVFVLTLACLVPTAAVFYAGYESQRAEYEKGLRERADRESQKAIEANASLQTALVNEEKALAAANVALKEARRNAYRSSLFPMLKAYEDGEYGLLRSFLRESEQRTDSKLFGWEWYHLRHSLRRQSTFFDFPYQYEFVRYSHDGSWLAFRRANGPIDIRRASDLELVKTLPGNRQMYFDWHPSKAWLAAATGDNELVIWNVDSGDRIAEFRTKDDTTKMTHRGVTWNPAGDQVALGGYRRVDVFNINGDESGGRRMKCLYYGRFVDWHPSRDLLAVGGVNCVQVIGSNSGAQVWHRYGNAIPVGAMTWNADGSKLAASWEYPWHRVEVFDPAGNREYTLELPQPVNTLHWLGPDDELILSGKTQKTQWWKISEAAPYRSLSIHESIVVSVDVQPGADRVIAIDDRGNVNRSSPARAERHEVEMEIPTGPTRIYRCFWHPSRPDLIALHSEHLVHVVDLSQKRIIQTYGTMNKFMRIAWHPHDPVLASLEIDGSICFRHVLRDEELRTLKAGSRGFYDSLEFDSSGEQLLIGSGNREPAENGCSAELVKVATDTRARFGPYNRRSLARFTADGQRLVMHSLINNEKRVRVWDVETQQPIIESPVLPAYFSEMDIHPDGHLAALSGQGGLLVVMNLESGEFMKQFTAHTSVIRSVYWSPDGTRLLTADDDNVLKIWTADTIELLATFQNGMGAASSWSPDGKRIATCTKAGVLRIYGSE